MPKLGLIVVDPGHFHAALAQKEMYPNVAETVRVYAPVGLNLVDYLTRIARFNTRAEAPTTWRLDIRAGDDFIDRMATEKAGDAAIFAPVAAPSDGAAVGSHHAGLGGGARGGRNPARPQRGGGRSGRDRRTPPSCPVGGQ